MGTRDVVVIGGGLSGLAAAHELEALGIGYTLIEVKPRLGGSLASRVIGDDSVRFVVDDGPMLTLDRPDATLFAQLGLAGDVLTARHDDDGAWLAFADGAEALVNALAAPLRSDNGRGVLMSRMAVSTIGQLDLPGVGRVFVICMENGMVLDARAVIVAAPARYAERIFHTLSPEISYRLLDYRYDSIARVSLGYRAAELGVVPLEPPADYPLTGLHTLTHAQAPRRVPPGCTLIQAGVRYEPSKGLSPDVVGELAALMGWPLNPLAEHIATWGESEPLMWLRDEFEGLMTDIRYLLPDGVALAGSDYVVTGDHRPTLEERWASGVQAARRVAAWVR
jgi:protoporphyrinogen oxidase